MTAATMADQAPWVLTRDRRWHASVSNLPLHEWMTGRTLCHDDVDMSRTNAVPGPTVRAKVCTGCLDALAEMGEPLPPGIHVNRRARR